MRVVVVLSFGILIGASVSSRASEPQGQGDRLSLSCDLFSSNISAVDLTARFGSDNVKTSRVPYGGAEGEYSEGTVLFADVPDARLEVAWIDRSNKRNPAWVSVRGKHSRWRTPAGLTLGTTLKQIERLNGRPFMLLGFGSDGSGTIMNWSAGRLDSQNSVNCRVRARVGLDWEHLDTHASALKNQVAGEKEFSSGDPAMQALDPAVFEMFLQYERRPTGGGH
jgi:hypothetical protein